ncbi:vacuolar sorting protein 9 domain-containing protein [Reticulomyxa filosa]|uniref:Vacuolar sorting protein 9 domain-containing protein n=1 Tax=Reticulomyxa filosa TaxID=46433 RepID=X6MCJ8_RETFI|nr:vacuolar sorting protein 9 domain-containing protein [Reticulomyxa filosa]|eukprot:ETO11177.1 vacuolar sorting protein 9 domain-containing protein [Reticulomyxa filosa]
MDEESVSEILASLNAEKDSYEYRLNILEALRQMMNDSNAAATNIKNSWHELGGFTTVLSLSTSLDSLWPDCDEHTSQLAIDLIEKSFIVIISIIKNHPRNRAYFWFSSWNSIADALIVTGVLKSPHCKTLFRILFDLAMEEIHLESNTTNSHKIDYSETMSFAAKKAHEAKGGGEGGLHRNQKEKEYSITHSFYDPNWNDNDDDQLGFRDSDSLFIKNPEALLVILKILSLCPEQFQLHIFEKLLSLINLSVTEINGEKCLLLRNKQLLTEVCFALRVVVCFVCLFIIIVLTLHILKHNSKGQFNMYMIYIPKALNQFIVELGTHRLSPAELNTMFTWAREHNERYRHVLQFLSGEHKFPFFEFESHSHRIACIKMAGQSHFNIIPEKGFSLAFWFNLRSGSKVNSELLLCNISKSNSSVNIMEMRYHCGNGSMVIKLANQEPNDYLICSDVKLQYHRWYHLCVTFQLLATTVANVKNKNKQTFDVLLYVNGIKCKHFHETILLKKKDQDKSNATKNEKKKLAPKNAEREDSSEATDSKSEKEKQEVVSHKIIYAPILQPCDCKLTIGVDSQHLLKQERVVASLVWWIGPFFVFAGVLAQKQVETIFDVGTDYGGTFHAARGVPYIQENEEKISHYPNRIDLLPPIACSFHPHSHYPFSEARRILLSNRADLEPEELSPFLLDASAVETSPLEEIVNIAGLRSPGGIIKNTSHDLNVPITHQGPYAYLNGGVTCIRPIALEDAIRYVGGVENLFGFLSRAHSAKAMTDHIAILATFLANNPKNLMDMARIGGYEMLGNILREKSDLITADLVPILISMVTNTIPKSIVEYLARSRNFTREVRISEPEIALYNHIGSPQSSYKKRIEAVLPAPTKNAELLSGVENSMGASSSRLRTLNNSRALETIPVDSTLSFKHSTVESMMSDSLASPTGNDSLSGVITDDVSMGLDHINLHQQGLSLFELPMVIERRYLQGSGNANSIFKDSEPGVKSGEFSSSARFIREEVLLANTLIMKYVILDFQIWSHVSTSIQCALYGWLMELCMTGPSIVSMEGMQKTLELSRIGGLPVTPHSKMVSSLSSRKWNAMRLRDLEAMDDVLYILSHRQVNTKTKAAMFQFVERLVMENFRDEELQLIAAFLVNCAMEVEYEYTQYYSRGHERVQLIKGKAEPNKIRDDLTVGRQKRSVKNSKVETNRGNNDNTLNTNNTSNNNNNNSNNNNNNNASPDKKDSRTTWIWHQTEGSMRHADIVVEFMKIFYVYVHNNMIHVKSAYEGNRTNAVVSPRKDMPTHTTNNSSSEVTSSLKSNFRKRLKSNARSSLTPKKYEIENDRNEYSKSNTNDNENGNDEHKLALSTDMSNGQLPQVLIDADFSTNFARMCDKLNIFWFAKLLSPALGGQVNRAALCVLNKILVTVDHYMETFSVT